MSFTCELQLQDPREENPPVNEKKVTYLMGCDHPDPGKPIKIHNEADN